MDILYLLVPLSVVAMLAVLGVFAWALHGGQLDNLNSEGERILWSDSQAPIDTGTAAPRARQISSPDLSEKQR
jgi:cbb3-type cytochrome oxidase maturation protein